MSKLLVTTSLIIYFYYNNTNLIRKEKMLVYFALFFSFMADFFLLHQKVILFLVAGMVMFVLAKICYYFLFSYSSKLDIDRLIPFLAIILLYCLCIMYFLYDGLGQLFIPVVIYTFASLSVAKIAYLRYHGVNHKSFYLVFIGSVLFIISETIMSLDYFYKPVSHSSVTVMLTYGLSQLLTVKGILVEKKRNIGWGSY
ncbi:lysoplasmalogenase [Abyssalbus ytuae]|uniref:Lysoplasmalogenase n=2 Tax=Abyssalbus ytuae TaxID=2926907 RepID=A0A9E6ZR97_9FLAO|nr:lysoplasmalogenase [Abyssalbus ytuae]UOB19459.1 lysoplasmalogenase [Abyssalbus ytuae]